VLAGMDTALTQLERAGLATRKLRLEDMFLLTGFSRDDSRSNRLLTTRLNEWPSFTVMLRVHPTLASMSGRGVNPGVLLAPAALDGNPSIWHGGWMSAVGMCLLGLDDGQPPPSGNRELEAVVAVLEDEMARAADKRMTGRSEFLARFARVIQHHDLALAEPPPASAPVPSAEPVKPKVEVRQGPKRNKPEPVVPLMIEPVSPLAFGGGLPPLTAGIDPEGEKATIGFAELLFQSPPQAPSKSGGGWWGQGAAADVAEGQVSGWGEEEPDTSPWWLKASVFLAGSMVAGAVCAHLTGGAMWLRYFKPPPRPEPPAAQAPAVPGKLGSTKAKK